MLRPRSLVLSLAVLAGAGVVPAVSAQQVECDGVALKTKSVTLDNVTYLDPVFGLFPSMQLLMRTRIVADEPTCLVAHFSALTRITDNWVVYHINVDGVPMEGQILSGGIPVVSNALDDVTLGPGNHEQFSDPTKNTSFGFFLPIGVGVHEIRVAVGAGSAIAAANPPQVIRPVLTLTY